MFLKLFSRHALAGALVIAPVIASAQRVVTNGGPWVPETRGTGSVFGLITGTNPRNGNGSLELSVDGDLTDWTFFNLFAGNPLLTPGWGLLSDVDRVGFDWFRVAMPPTGDVPWQRQTPVLRLYVRSGDAAAPTFSELVWERYYNADTPAPTDQWISENLSNQFFWRVVTGQGYTIADCSNPPDITPGIPLRTASPATWGSPNNCYDSNAIVYGIGVGLGSNWPNPYEGFVDNVQLGFAGDESLTVWDNFELADSNTTPEPATLVLFGSGAIGIGGAWIRRRRGSRSRT
jgi:PEP-CTERM motif-containing protein